MNVILYNDINKFKEEVLPLLYKEEELNQIFIQSIKEQQGFVGRDNIIGTVVDKNEIRVIFLNEYPYSFQLYGVDINKEVSDYLCQYIKKEKIKIASITGSKRDTEIFISSYSEVFKMKQNAFVLISEMDVMKVSSLQENVIDSTKLILKEAEETDLEQIGKLYKLFEKEVCGGEISLEDAIQKMKIKVQNKDCFILLNHEGNIVSTSHVDTTLKNGVSISGVYTSLENRNKGYATILMYLTSKLLLNRGYASCALCADRTKPELYLIYSKVGYKVVGISCCYKLDKK